MLIMHAPLASFTIMKSNTLVIRTWREWVNLGIKPEKQFCIFFVPIHLTVLVRLLIYINTYQYLTGDRGV